MDLLGWSSGVFWILLASLTLLKIRCLKSTMQLSQEVAKSREEGLVYADGCILSVALDAWGCFEGAWPEDILVTFQSIHQCMTYRKDQKARYKGPALIGTITRSAKMDFQKCYPRLVG